ncbi:MAG: glycosyltransferase family 1 protein [Candidatus Aureabacteria bacterium]|nr:glycosyltransferase family 1 protein [Candidatus Auribacterota bacterium]
MKIAIDIQPALLTRAGIGQYTYYLAKYLPVASPSDSFTGLAFGGAEEEIGELRTPNFRIRHFRGISRRGMNLLWKTMHWPPADLFTGAVDVFHFPSFVARPLRSGKTVVTIHDLAFKRMPECSEPKNAAFLTRHLPRTLEQAALVIADSEFTAKELVEFYAYPRKRVRVIPLGVEESFHPRAKLSDRLRGILPERYMLFVGTIEPRKNIGTLLEVYALLRKTRRNVPALVIAGHDGWRGEGGRIARLIERLSLHDSVIRLNYVAAADLPGLYAAAHLFVFPALYEGFGLPPLEAMASGVPVVCSNAGSLPEVAGDAAALIPPRDPEKLAQAIAILLDDTGARSSMIAKGLARAKKFTWSETARGTIGAYRDALSEGCVT